MSLLDKASLIVTPNSYKESVLYSVVPNTTLGDMNVVRATTATRVNEQGLIESVGLNIPRIDYTNGSCPGLLVEPQRTNLLTYSNDFIDTAWVKLNCSITANNTTSPDGNVNASKLTSTVAGNFLYNAVTTANGIYTFSCFVKKLDTDNINISVTDFATGSSFGIFNFTTGLFTLVVNGGSWTNTTANVISLQNGWFKISLTSQKNAGTVVSSRIDSFDVGTSVYIYGAQLEAGSYPTSYIPTVSTSITRNADVISKTGISSLIGQTEGTAFVDFYAKGKYDALNMLLLISDGTSANMFYIALTDGKFEVYMQSSSTPQFVYSGATILNENSRNKIAIGYANNDIILYHNGVQLTTDATATIPTTSSIRLGSYLSDSFLYNSGINSTQLYKTRLTNTELAQLTTI